MKKLSTIIALTVSVVAGFAQGVDLRRRIEVTGVAEKEITPDIINVSISLKEYMDGKKKITISELEQQLEKAVQAAGIAKDDFRINNLSSYNFTDPKKKTPEFLASKQYGICFRDLNKFNQVISKIDAKGIQYTNIDSYDYSKIDYLRNELKLQALVTAKTKATFMLNGIGEKVGQPISITEFEDNSFPQPRNVMYMAKASVANEAADTVPQSDIDIKMIKLNYRVSAVFETAGK